MLRKFVFNAGINKEGTRYSVEAGWYDGSNVRFRKGFPEKIGGWEKLSAHTYLGACRKLHNWASYNGDDYMGLGTSTKAYVELGGRYYDVTPPRYKTEGRMNSSVDASTTTNFRVPEGTYAADVLLNSYLKIGNEYVLVTGTTGSTTAGDVIVVTRAQAGTAAATYDNHTAYFQILRADANPIGIVNGTSTVVFKQVAHGASTGDRFTFISISSDFTSNGITRANLLSGYATATSIQGFEITRVMSPDFFEFEVPGSTGTNDNTTLASSIGTSDTTITLTSGSSFVAGEIVKIDSEYIELGSKSTHEFSSCKRGQLGSLAVGHSSLAPVSQISFFGTNVYALYDIPAESGPSTASSGFGAGRWSGFSELGQTSTSLNGLISDSASTIALVSTADFTFPGEAIIGSELVSYTGVSSPNLTGVTRGFDSTVADSHSDGTVVYYVGTNWTAWGEGSATSSQTRGLRMWSIDNYKDDIVLAPRDGVPYIWSRSLKTSGSVPLFTESGAAGSNNGMSNSQAVPLSSVGVPSDLGFGSVPGEVKQIMMYPDYSVVVAFGCSEPFGDQLFNPMLVRWSADGLPGSWTGGSTSTAGGKEVSTGSYIIGAIRSKKEIILWTDESTYLMSFIVQSNGGGDFIFTEIASGVSIISQNACMSGDDVLFWMGDRNFYIYDGSVSILKCSVLDYVFSSLKYVNKDRIIAVRNSEFSEITWFYPSANSTDNDRYVSYNYEDGNWSIGNLPRTAWSDSGIREHPIAAYIVDEKTSRNYVQEMGTTGDGAPVDAYIRSGSFDIEDGDHVSYVSKIVPDIYWIDGGTADSPVSIDIFSRRYTQGNDDVPVQTVSVTEQSLDPSTRVRGRQMSLKFSSNTNDSRWRLGSLLMDIKPDGRR